MRPSTKVILLLFACGILSGLLILKWLGMFGEIAAGHNYDPHDSGDLQRLQAIARTAQPLIAALDRYKVARNSYPKALADIPFEYFPHQPVIDGDVWGNFRYYARDLSRYTLSTRLSHDSSLDYVHDPRYGDHWYFDRGDGSPHTQLDKLNQ
jgi:hypothetical protein